MNGRFAGTAGGFDGVPGRARFSRCGSLMAKRGIIDHAKTLGLAASLDIDECFAVGILESLFQWVSKHRFTGELTGAKPKVLAAAIRYRGDADALVRALVAVGAATMVGDDVVVAPADTLRPWASRRARRWMRERAAGGVVSREVRAAVFERDQRRCVRCASVDDLTIDHAQPISMGGTNDAVNLQCLCRRCNSSKGIRTEVLHG